MRAIFLRLLSHEANVWYASHCGGIKCSVLFAKIDRSLIDPCIGPVRNNEFRILLITIWPPHLSRSADGRGHRCIDDDVARDVEIGNPLVRVHHGKIRTILIDTLNVCLDFGPLRFGESRDLGKDVTQPIVDIHSQRIKSSCVFIKDGLVENGDRMTEDDRVRYLHHRSL